MREEGGGGKRGRHISAAGDPPPKAEGTQQLARSQSVPPIVTQLVGPSPCWVLRFYVGFMNGGGIPPAHLVSLIAFFFGSRSLGLGVVE